MEGDLHSIKQFRIYSYPWFPYSLILCCKVLT